MGFERNEQKAIPPSHHYGDADKLRTGREAEGVTDDISSSLENAEPLDERVRKGIHEIIDALGMRPQEIMGMTDFFVRQLSERGYLTEKDLRFNPENVVSDLLKDIARKAA